MGRGKLRRNRKERGKEWGKQGKRPNGRRGGGRIHSNEREEMEMKGKKGLGSKREGKKRKSCLVS